MAFQLSPGVNVSEIDLTTVVPAVATSDGAIAGVFRWGPIGQRVLIDSENQLVNRFGKPTNHNAETFFSAANFLAYSNRLYVSRAAKTTGETPVAVVNSSPVASANAELFSNVFTCSDTSKLEIGMYVTQATNNAVANSMTMPYIVAVNSSSITLSQRALVNTSVQTSLYFARPDTTYSAVAVDAANTAAVVANLVNQIVKNENEYVNKDGNFDLDVLYVARYPGALGNSIRVSVVDNAQSFSSNIALDSNIRFEIGSSTSTIKFLGSANALTTTTAAKFATNDYLLAGNSSISTQYLLITDVTAAGNATANVVFDASSTTTVNAALGFIAFNNSNNILTEVGWSLESLYDDTCICWIDFEHNLTSLS